METDNRTGALTYSRYKALVLLVVWRGFRNNELLRLHVDYIKVTLCKGLTIFLTRSKADRNRVEADL